MSEGDWVHVSIARQVLELCAGPRCVRQWPVSTGKAGAGETHGSGRTPRGWHCVRIGIGAGAPDKAVFVGRRATGEIWTPALADAQSGRDWILTRILWLTGCEPGRNRGGHVDTLRRFIYIHGTPEESRLGQPVSAGCIRMANADVRTFFDLCRPRMPVFISEEGSCSDR